MDSPLTPIFPSSQVHLYLHIPFCHHICPYCAFYKHQPGNLANAAFIAALLTEADQRCSEFPMPPLETIYFGGGTPTLLSAKHLQGLCEGLRKRFHTDALGEWTIEANPATFDLRKAEAMRALGITRVSLGVQSFQPETLETLGRDHSPQDAIDAYHVLRQAGFPGISIDLMFSIPGQTPSQWRADLEQATALEPDHISTYNLTYEEDTEYLERHQQGELDANEDRDADFFYAAIDFLEAKGYRHYEISNFARPGHESQHNRAYWNGEDYLGLGPGAVTTLGNQRWKTLPDTARYIEALQSGADTRTEIENLTKEDKRLEALALQLRTREGAPKKLAGSEEAVALAVERGFVTVQNDRLILTREGKALADPVAAELV